MHNYFLIFDSFGINMSFYLKGYKNFRSNFGGVATIIIYMVSIICGFIFANEMLIKYNPTISTASAIYPNPTKLYYPDNIFFMISLNIDSVPFIDETIYRPMGYIKTRINGTESLIERKISLDICSNVFDEKYKYYESIKHLNLNNFYCLALDKNKNNGIDNDELFINEFWGNDGFQMLQIKIYNCSAIAENKSECAPNEIIKEKLKSPIVTYYTLKNYIDTSNYKNPYIRGLQETFYYVSYKKFISATEYIKHVIINSDIGYLFYNLEVNEDSTVDSMVEYSEIDQDDGKIFTMSIQLTNKIDIYNRSYYKLQDLGADVGAIYGILHMIFQILFGLYNSSKLFLIIMNNFFLIKEDFKPISREKKGFIQLKKNFYNDLKLNISLQDKNYFHFNHNNIKDKNDDIIKTTDSLNNNSKKIINNNDKFNICEKSHKNNKNNEPKIKIINTDCSINQSNNNILNIIKNKKEEEKKRIKVNFSFIDRFICLYIVNICRNKVHRYSYYNLYYKGKNYIENVLDINNYLKYNHFLKMFFLFDGKETKELYEYVTTPILSSNYVGPRFEVEE